MSLPHEDAAKEVYSSARDFRPVVTRKILRNRTTIIGWTFVIDSPSGVGDMHAWITCDHQITSDPTRRADVAPRMLRAYVKYSTGPGAQVVSSGGPRSLSSRDLGHRDMEVTKFPNSL